MNYLRKTSIRRHLWRSRHILVCMFLQLIVADLPRGLTVSHQSVASVITRTSLTSSARVNWPEDDDSFNEKGGNEQEQGIRQATMQRTYSLVHTSFFPTSLVSLFLALQEFPPILSFIPSSSPL